jgi:phosphoribosylformylglycinamidine cyclo-ligase
MRLTYKDAGVDTLAKERFIEKILSMMRRTYGPAVIEKRWGFAGLYSLAHSKLFEKRYKNPVLVGTTDGVGTKLIIASVLGKYDSVGIDLVAMNINDLITTGAIPLFFMDYIAAGKLKEKILMELVKGIVEGCRQAGCALLAGETAEMPGFYDENRYELAGSAIGIVEATKIIDGRGIKPGDDIIGLGSNGLHSNGFSLVRKIIQEKALKLNSYIPSLKGTLAEELLKPTTIYAEPIRKILRGYKVKSTIKGIANITGGGLVENLPRILPKNCSAELYPQIWEIPPIFTFLQEQGQIETSEMYRVFNMGIGMVLVVDPYFSLAILKRLKKLRQKAFIIGKIIKGNGKVNIREY